MALNKISTPSLKEVFVNEIENRIISGEFKLGDKLPTERELGELMGVSLTIVKQGISDVENKGFIEVRPRRGLFVADFVSKGSFETLASIMRYNGGKLGNKEIRSFCETRRALDKLAFDLVIERASDSEINGVGQIVENIKKAKDAENITEICKFIIEFYHKLYILSDNIILPLFYYSTAVPQIEMYTKFIDKNGTDLVFDNIVKIYESILARDKDAVYLYIYDAMKMSLEGDTAII